MRFTKNIKNSFIPIYLFKIIVRPSVEFASSVWSPSDGFIGLNNRLEQVSRRFVKIILLRNNISYHRSEYNYWLQNLNMKSLEHRRNEYDVKLFLKILNGNLNVTYFNDFILFNHPVYDFRGCSTFYIPYSRTNIRIFSFFIRANYLYEQTVAYLT